MNKLKFIEKFGKSIIRFNTEDEKNYIIKICDEFGFGYNIKESKNHFGNNINMIYINYAMDCGYFGFNTIDENYYACTIDTDNLINKFDNPAEVRTAIDILKHSGLTLCLTPDMNGYYLYRNNVKSLYNSSNDINLKTATLHVKNINFNRGFEKGKESKIEEFKKLFNL